MLKHKGKIFWAALILFVLAASYFYGGNYAKGVAYKNDTPVDIIDAEPPEQASEATDSPAVSEEEDAVLDETEDAVPDTKKEEASAKNKAGDKPYEGSAEYSEKQGMVLDKKTGKDKYLTDPVPEGKPLPVEPEDVITGDKAYTATLSVSCNTLLDNMKYLDKEKWELVPEDGVIFPAGAVTFYEGESVFNLLQREMKKNKIHMEFSNTPIYNSAYIRGIHNLYEFDAGELSGWMYKVNGWFPNYGCSRYQLADGDVIEWVYTMDLGRDVGGYYTMGGQE